MKRFFLILLSAITVTVTILLYNTLTFKSHQLTFPAAAVSPPDEVYTQHLSEAIKYKTISYGDSSRLDTAAFYGFHRFLARTYPLVHSKLSLTKVAKYSLLFQWKGTRSDLNPIVFMAHQDVVPVEEATSCAGCVILIVEIFVQPFASFTVTVCVPAATFEKVFDDWYEPLFNL